MRLASVTHVSLACTYLPSRNSIYLGGARWSSQVVYAMVSKIEPDILSHSTNIRAGWETESSVSREMMVEKNNPND